MGNFMLNKSEQTTRMTFLLILALGITLLFFSVIKGFVLPLIMAAVLTAVAQPLYKWFLKKWGGRETVAALVTVIIFLLTVIIPTLFFIGMLVRDAVSVSNQMGDWVTKVSQDPEALQTMLSNNATLQKILPYQDQIMTKIAQFASTAASYIAQALVGGAAGIASFFLKLFICLFAMFQFLKDGPRILDWIFKCTPATDDDRKQIETTFSSVARATLKGTLVIGIVQGGLAGAAFAVAGINGALFWSAIMAVLSIIPGVGTAIVWVPTVIYLAMTGQWGAAIGVGAWCAVIVGTADNVLRPLLVGKDTKMSELMVLLTTLGGLTFVGAAGIVIGPVIGALFTTIWTLWSSTVEPENLAVKSTP